MWREKQVKEKGEWKESTQGIVPWWLLKSLDIMLPGGIARRSLRYATQMSHPFLPFWKEEGQILK